MPDSLIPKGFAWFLCDWHEGSSLFILIYTAERVSAKIYCECENSPAGGASKGFALSSLVALRGECEACL